MSLRLSVLEMHKLCTEVNIMDAAQNRFALNSQRYAQHRQKQTNVTRNTLIPADTAPQHVAGIRTMAMHGVSTISLHRPAMQQTPYR